MSSANFNGNMSNNNCCHNGSGHNGGGHNGETNDNNRSAHQTQYQHGRHLAITEKKVMLHGADYNPDQWLHDQAILNEDIRLMKKTNVNVVSLGIFSWSSYEAHEGVYTFEWLDQMMDSLYQNGIGVNLATPSGARPAWLAQKYSEVLRVNKQGVRNLFGERHNHCLTSPIYRQKVNLLNTKLAERYHNHPALLTWHISNEYSGECFCTLCLQAFRDWLKIKFKNNLEELNFQYWTNFWSHRFTDWDQIMPPMQFGDKVLHGLAVDWRRFVTDQTIDFFENEMEPIRKLAPNKPVTTNFMITQDFDGLNYEKFAKHVDFISWDSYPKWHTDPSRSNIEVGYATAFNHDRFRAMKQKPFLLMESTPSLTNWQTVNSLKRPNCHMSSSLQAVAHGSDGVLYFQWRKSRGGTEKFHGAVLGHDGNDQSRVFKEVQALGERLTQMDEIVGATTIAEVAVVYDLEVRWALQEMTGLHNEIKDYCHNCIKHYGGLWKQSVNIDVVDQYADFSGYKVVVAPTSYLIKPGFSEKITSFVNNGGTFIATFFSGVVNENDLCFTTGNPGPLRALLGIYAEEIDTLNPEITNYIVADPLLIDSDELRYPAKLYCELIHSEGAEVLARYDSDFYAGMPAVTVNHYGKGQAYYIAFNPDERFVADFYRAIVQKNNLKINLPDLPEGVTATTRSVLHTTNQNKDKTEFIFVINFNEQSNKVRLTGDYKNQATNEPLTEIDLPPFGCCVLKKDF